MPFAISIPRHAAPAIDFALAPGDRLIVLGANGSGKSSLMLHLYNAHRAHARRVAAHRQTWFSSNSISLSPESRRNTETNIKNSDGSPDSRWKDDYGAERPMIALYDLINAENVRARTIAAAVDAGDFALARQRSTQDAPIKTINELLRLSNIPIAISRTANEQIVATRLGGPEYSIAELSDGERNALLIASEVLTAREGSLLLIDEPERHLHRSIISPLLTLLFQKRPDCAFVISTHEVMLPLDSVGARTVLLRACSYSGRNVALWDADLLESDADVSEEVKAEILGSRRALLFVEGTERSLDKPLYSLLFPQTSVVAKSSCRDVEHAVSSLRDAPTLHWVRAFGIVDNDRRTPDEIEQLRAKGVHALSAFSVESIYYHPEVLRRVTERHVAVVGGDAAQRLSAAINAALAVITPHVGRLSERAVERALREKVLRQLPTRPQITSAQPISLYIDVAAEKSRERDRLQALVDECNVEAILRHYPVRETPALSEIAHKLGFTGNKQYESAVLQLLVSDADALNAVRQFFGSLPLELAAP